MMRSLQQIAEAVGARLVGDGRVEVSGVASIASASKDDIVFVDDEKHLGAALRSRRSGDRGGVRGGCDR
jgi:UDP-3-O-[3-hydroxymyristoyl] glucosamine N-acyltransferase